MAMSFSSMSFIFAFLPIVLILYRITPHKYKNALLLIASLFFYAWGNIWHALLLIMLILINFFLGIYIDHGFENERKRRLIESVILNVVILAYFKYYGFFLNTIGSIVALPNYQLFTVPLGISFFTFSILSYLIDVGRKKISAEYQLLPFALFVSFFPKLVMGPIEHYENMRKQFDDHPLTSELFEQGCSRFLTGLAMKVILANTMGSLWSQVNTLQLSALTAWLGILAYTLQIYFDFKGYMLMARGLANMFGFHISRNFYYPYMAFSITDFWRRWHITLSTWFKDYVYIPLGGNRKTIRITIRNLMIVWFLTGIWHGSSWNFILWGSYYGILLIIEKFVLQDFIKKLPKVVRWFYTILAVMVGWVLFVSKDMTIAIDYLKSMMMLKENVVMDQSFLFLLKEYGIYLLIGILCCTPFFTHLAQQVAKKFYGQLWFLKPVITISVWIILISYLLSNTYQSFLYFQF